jgi:L-lactate dehydrogenase
MKIGVVGTGFVGATAAYALVMRGIGRQIVLVDKSTARAQAEADDLYHAVPFAHPLQVLAGDYPDLEGCRVVVVAAGVNQQPGETRLQLLERNRAVFKQVIPSILKYASEAVLLIATNPVDVMTHLAARFAAEQGVVSTRVIGSGTTLDTARFRALLGRRLGVDSHHIHAYVIGEHGDSEVLTWSLISVGGIPLEEFCEMRKDSLDDSIRQQIDHQVRRAAYHIIQGKGATYYGIGSALARIVDVILRDEQAILTVCTPISEIVGIQDVTVALPHLVGGQGILATFPPPINESERLALSKSVLIVHDAIAKL